MTNDLNRGPLGDNLVGFAVDARDGRVGKVDRVNYERTYIVVTTRRWPARRHVVPASAIASVDPGRRPVFVLTSKRDIISGPTYDDEAEIDRDPET
jgi:hypothetical protein